MRRHPIARTPPYRSLLCLAALLLAAMLGACDNEFPDEPLGTGEDVAAIRGQVTAAGTGVGDVRIVLVQGDSTLTRADGVYEFTGLVPRQYGVQLRLPLGFRLAPGEETLKQATVAAGGVATVDWRLVRE